MENKGETYRTTKELQSYSNTVKAIAINGSPRQSGILN
jgi:hypothetical protein